MQVTETLAEGLRREYRVVVPVSDLDAKVNERLVEIKDKVRINGFRPGKVPVAHLKRIYGRSVMADAIDAAVREATASIVADHGLKLAMEPKVTLPTAEGEVTELIEGKADLAYSVAMEILPKIQLADFKSIQVEKPIAEVSDQEVADTLDKIAEQNRPYAAKPEGGTAENGDKVTVSFTGTIDGAPFEGGTGEDIAVLIGSKTFHSWLRGAAPRDCGGRDADRDREIPDELPDREPGRQGGGVPGHRQVGRVTGNRHHRRRVRQVAGHGKSLQALKDAAKDRLARACDGHPAAAQAFAARCARRAP